MAGGCGGDSREEEEVGVGQVCLNLHKMWCGVLAMCVVVLCGVQLFEKHVSRIN